MQLTVNLKPSNSFKHFITFIHLGAIIAVLFLTINILIKLMIIIICLVSLCYALFKYVYLWNQSSIIKISADNDKNCRENWRIKNNTGEELVATLSGDSLITGFLLILNFRVIKKNRRRSVVIFKDSVGQKTFHELCRFIFSLRS